MILFFIGKKCTYGKKCKYFHPEVPLSSVAEHLMSEQQRKVQEARTITNEVMNSASSIAGAQKVHGYLLHTKIIGDFETVKTWLLK